MSDAEIAPTDMIHMSYEGNFQLDCDATVLMCRQVGDCVEIQLDRTTMHPQGGGQPTDVGKLVSVGNGNDNDDNNEIVITKVMLDRVSGVVTHTGKADSNNNGNQALVVGSKVQVRVDPDTRQVLSECHTAGHVVDSAMARCDKLLEASKAYHFLDGPYVEYKGSIPPDERPGLLEKLKQAFQDLVEEDIPTTIETVSKEEATKRVQLVDLEPYGDQVRIVSVAGWTCPCGGTHVKSTSHLKGRKWGITGIKSKKGVVRIKYGQEAI